MMQFKRLLLHRMLLKSLNHSNYQRTSTYHGMMKSKSLIKNYLEISVPNSLCFHNRLCSRIAASTMDKKIIYQSLMDNYDQSIVLDDLEKEDLCLLSERFNLKALNIQHIHKYSIKVSSDLSTILFPFESLKKELVAIQTITYKNDAVGERLVPNTFPKLYEDQLFGWSLVGSNDKTIIVTSNPLDAVAANQETDLPAISLPLGFAKFSFELVNILKQFKKVIFWLKPELHSWDVHKFLVQNLLESAFAVRPQEYDSPLVSLQRGTNFGKILCSAGPLNVEGNLAFPEEILENIKRREKVTSHKWKRFAPLNDLLKGHRPGELTVFSGQTGTGKTTFLSEYSLDLCTQGIPTLWASFEICNTKLMETMLHQFSRCSLADDIEAYSPVAKEFFKIPMFFLNVHSLGSFKAVLKALSEIVGLYNIQHIVVDNLQFMMNMEEYKSSLDQLRSQDQIFGDFRRFATQFNCHLTVVIHPRKEPEFSELSITSISGTPKAAQEADNVLILQTTKTRQYLQVTKNRFDGQKGCILLEFDKRNLTYNLKCMNSKSNSIL